MTGDETLSAQLERLRETYDDAIDALARPFGVTWTERPRDAADGDGWPTLTLHATPEGTVTFQGFHIEFRTTVPADRRAAFLAAATDHLDASPRHAYDSQERPDED